MIALSTGCQKIMGMFFNSLGASLEANTQTDFQDKSNLGVLQLKLYECSISRVTHIVFDCSIIEHALFWLF